jgi:hypothetical protein
MLFPNATNFVAPIFGGDVTVTVKLHDADRKSASVAVHVTVEAPRTKSAPLSGEHVVLMGGSPATTDGP